MSARDFAADVVVAAMGGAVEAGWVCHPEPFWKVCCKSCVQEVGACFLCHQWSMNTLSY